MLERGRTFQRLAAALPDIPRWLETRSMLLSDEAEVLGLEEADALSFVARDPVTHLISIVGRPDADAVREAVWRNEGRGVAICQQGNEEYCGQLLQGWRAGPATLHLLETNRKLPDVPPGRVAFVPVTEILAMEEVPLSLRDELRAASLRSQIAATIEDGKPVAFCYAASITETLWDISIDTLGPYRRRGYAALAVAWMVRQMAERGKRPVWGAEESNTPSMSLARKLGFRPADRLIVLRSPQD